MPYLTVILRLFHIVGGAFWFGSAMMMSFFVSPTVAATAEAGQKFMGHLVSQRRLVTVISFFAGLTVVTGAGLYWIDSGGFTSAWQWSNSGMVFGIGGILGLIGFIFGMQIGANTKRLIRIGSEIQGKPTAEQTGQIQAAQRRLRFVGPVSAYSLILALICMSVARYWF